MLKIAYREFLIAYDKINNAAEYEGSLYPVLRKLNQCDWADKHTPANLQVSYRPVAIPDEVAGWVRAALSPHFETILKAHRIRQTSVEVLE